MSHWAALTLAGVRVGGAARAGAAGAAVMAGAGAGCGLVLATAVMACVGAALGTTATPTGGT